MSAPVLSVVIPTFNNRPVLQRCLEGWQRYAPTDGCVEIIVVQDGSGDDTGEFLENMRTTDWGQRNLRHVREDNVHELRCTNRGFREARGSLLAAWQDDMILQRDWFVPELIRNFEYPDLALLSLSRGLDCFPCSEPINTWHDLHDSKRMRSNIGPRFWNWWRLQEVDLVIRPWVVRRACLELVGFLDEAFCPTEWDEADLCYRIREAGRGWKIAVHSYERCAAYLHLGSTTLQFSPKYQEQVTRNGRLFHERWQVAIGERQKEPRRSWLRRLSLASFGSTVKAMAAGIASRSQPRGEANK